MPTVPERRTLVVANRTAATPLLLNEIRRRAGEQPTAFVLLCPQVASRKGPDWTLEQAVKALRGAAAGSTGRRPVFVEGVEGVADPFEAVKTTLAQGEFDDVIVSTLPKRTSEWLKRDLPHRVEALGLPVTVITMSSGERLKANEAMLWNVNSNPRGDQEET